MGDRALSVVLTAAACAAIGACGDALVLIGDAPGIVRIVAGIPDSAGSEIGTRATSSVLRSPHGLAAGGDGVLYVADRGNARILAVASSGDIEVLAERSEDARLREPSAVALDGRGGLVIADPRAQRIWRLDLDSRELNPVAGTGTRGSADDGVAALEADLDTPTGVAVGPGDRIHFTEALGHRIRRIESDGTLRTVAGVGAPGSSGDAGPAIEARLEQPTHLTFGADTLFISDTGNHKIRVIDLETGTIGTLAGRNIPGFAGDGGPADDARLDTPRGLALAPDARTLFIADSENHRIRSVDLSTRIISTFAGTGQDEFNGDLREAGATTLRGPRGLASSSFGFLFIADTGHQIVRRTAIRFVAVDGD